MSDWNWNAVERGAELRCKTERLIMQDRIATARPTQHLGYFEDQFNAATKMFAQGLQRLNQLLDTVL